MTITHLAHLAVTTYLAAVVTALQLFHYPTFTHIEKVRWHQFHRSHVRNLTFLLYPFMVAELMLAVQLQLSQGSGFHLFFIAGSLLTWAITLFGIVPMNNKLATKPMEDVFTTLLQRNAYRTITWVIISLSAIYQLSQYAGSVIPA